MEENKDAETLRRNFAEYLLPAYEKSPFEIACLCDEKLDRTGALLGYLRELAYKKLKKGAEGFDDRDNYL